MHLVSPFRKSACCISVCTHQQHIECYTPIQTSETKQELFVISTQYFPAQRSVSLLLFVKTMRQQRCLYSSMNEMIVLLFKYECVYCRGFYFCYVICNFAVVVQNKVLNPLENVYKSELLASVLFLKLLLEIRNHIDRPR